jgi:hypothetical protein
VETLRVVAKDSIRFAVAAEGGPAITLEIRVRPDRFGGWQATALLHEGDVPVALGRVFRSRDRRLAAGKMVTWVRRRYLHVRPLAERGSAVPHAGAGA